MCSYKGFIENHNGIYLVYLIHLTSYLCSLFQPVVCKRPPGKVRHWLKEEGRRRTEHFSGSVFMIVFSFLSIVFFKSENKILKKNNKVFIHLHLCGFYLMLCQSLWITPGSCSHPTWPCACGPCAPSRPPRSRTRCGSCPSCVQRLLSWLWTGLWSCWPGFLHSKTSSRVQMSSFHWSYYVVLANKNQGGRQDEENDTIRDKAWSDVSWLADWPLKRHCCGWANGAKRKAVFTIQWVNLEARHLLGQDGLGQVVQSRVVDGKVAVITVQQPDRCPLDAETQQEVRHQQHGYRSQEENHYLG